MEESKDVNMGCEYKVSPAVSDDGGVCLSLADRSSASATPIRPLVLFLRANLNLPVDNCYRTGRLSCPSLRTPTLADVTTFCSSYLVLEERPTASLPGAWRTDGPSP